ncbi:MAG: hypothetical protein JW804_04145 [Sedimentisphaerales bacterium]|nr:hypothetical protein [Sedimentisphaerales bacterium]
MNPNNTRTISKPLFPETSFQAPNKMGTFNKEKIIEILSDATKQNSIQTLRQKIYELSDQVAAFSADKMGVWNIGSNGDTVRLNQKYLMDDLKQIAESQTLERCKYYLKRLIKGISEHKTSRVNDINLNRWKEYPEIITDSLWILDKRDSSGVHTAGYWGNFIPQIPYQMIQRYTKRDEWVLDTFAGCGTTLIETQRLGRNGIGIELQGKVVETANSLINSEPNKYNTFNKAYQGDSAKIDYKSILKQHNIKTVQLLIMHPPYFDIIKFSDNPNDLSNAKTVDEFLSKMKNIVERATEFLEKGRYFVLVIGDKYSKGEWIPLGFLTMQEVLKTGFTLKSIIVKNFEDTSAKRNQKELWRYRAIVGGFYIFKHEYIFVFKKEAI